MASTFLSEIVIRKATPSDHRRLNFNLYLQVIYSLIFFSLFISIIQSGNTSFIFIDFFLRIISNLLGLILFVTFFSAIVMAVSLVHKKVVKDKKYFHENEIFVVVYRKKVIGYLYVFSEIDYSCIYRFDINRKFRYRGIGSIAIRYVSDQIVRPIYIIKVGMGRKSKLRLIRFYERLGFIITRHQDLPEMVKKLRSPTIESSTFCMVLN